MATKDNSGSRLSNDVVGLIVNRISNSDDRKSFSEVCKQWGTVEGLNRTSIRLLQLDYLRRVLPRFPNLVTFETSTSITPNDLEFLAQTCTKIEAVDLGKPNDDVEPKVLYYEIKLLYALAHNSFPKLSKVSLRNRRCNGGAIASLIKAKNKLRHLDLGYCCVLDETLEAIGSSQLTYLNLEGCDKITDSGLGFLGNGSCSKTLKTLVLAGCSGITKAGPFWKMASLEELYLGGVLLGIDELRSVPEIPTLKKLNLGIFHEVDELGKFREIDPSVYRQLSDGLFLEGKTLSIKL